MVYFILLSLGEGALFLDGEKLDNPDLHMWFQEPRSDEKILLRINLAVTEILVYTKHFTYTIYFIQPNSGVVLFMKKLKFRKIKYSI